MDTYDIVVVGGGYSGMTAVDRIAAHRPSVRVALVDGKDEFVERIRLHEAAAGHERKVFRYEPHLKAIGAGFMQGRVESIDTGASRLRIAGADGSRHDWAYRHLILALGSRTNKAVIPGIAEHAVCLDSVEDAAELARWARGGGRLLVIGGGLTSFESVAEFAETFPSLRVTLVSAATLAPSDAPGGYSAAAVDYLRRTFQRLNVQFLENTPVQKLQAGRAVLAGGEVIEFDRCIWAGGFSVSDLPQRAGIAVGKGGRIACAPTLQSVSHPQIIATGDIAEVNAEPSGVCRMSCAAGRPMGEAAAASALALLDGAKPAAFHFAFTFRCISLGRQDGLIQFVDVMDRPLAEVWTGARAARWKEYVCSRTVAGVGLTAAVEPPDTPPVALNSQQALKQLQKA